MAEPLQISASPTPNPNAVKLTLNRVVSEQGRTFRAGAPNGVPADAPWAQALLSVAGIVAVYGVNNFISINKQPEASWDTIVPQAEAALQRAFP